MTAMPVELQTLHAIRCGGRASLDPGEGLDGAFYRAAISRCQGWIGGPGLVLGEQFGQPWQQLLAHAADDVAEDPGGRWIGWRNAMGEELPHRGQVAAGRLRVLVALSPERMEGTLASVPTAIESGVDVTWVTWRGFYVPGEIGDEAYDRWVDILRQVGASPAWDEARRTNRLQPFFMTGEEFSTFVKNQVTDFREMSREIGLIR